MDIALLIGRILFGGFFVMMGLNHFMKAGMLKSYASSKGVPAPGIAVPVTGLLILLGGLGYILGYEIFLSSIFIIIFLFFVSLKMHNFWAIQDPEQKMPEMINFMKNTALLGATLIMMALHSSGMEWAMSI